ncbi:MAG: ABC transporter permease [Thermoplasmata archaeon]
MIAHRGFGLARGGLLQRFATFLTMSKKTIVEFSRYPVAFVALFAQTFLIILMFLFAAFAFTEPGSGLAGGVLIAGVMVYGLIIQLFLSFTLWEVGFSIREEQFRGTLESLYMSPASRFGSLVSRIFAILLWTSVMAVFAVFLVGLLVNGLPAENLLLAMVVLFFTITGLLGLGLLMAAITIRLKESAQFLVSFLQFFFIIFAAMFFPFGALPDVMVDYVSRYLPVAYSVDAFRSLLLGLPAGFPELLPLTQEILIVVLFGILAPPVSYLLYKEVERRARTQGTLGEY